MKLLLTLLALLPLPALASGFYVPWWIEALLFLTTPGGMVMAAVGLAVIVVLIVRARK